MLLKQLNIIFDIENVFIYDGQLYEKLNYRSSGFTYRIIINENDYEWAQDSKLIKKLDQFTRNLE